MSLPTATSSRPSLIPQQTSSHHHIVPYAQVSMTSPRIAVDSASEAGSMFNVSMTVSSQFKADDTNVAQANNFVSTSSSSGSLSVNTIRYIGINPTESLLLSCSRAGTKLWSLNSHPIQQVATYHNTSNTIPFTASFLRSGSHLATCDGCINIWDIEMSRVVAYIGGSPLQSPFHSMFATSSRHGLSPGVQPLGDDQLLTSKSRPYNPHIINYNQWSMVDHQNVDHCQGGIVVRPENGLRHFIPSGWCHENGAHTPCPCLQWPIEAILELLDAR